MTACKDKNDLPAGINWRKVTEYGGGTWVPDARHPDLLVANNIYQLRRLHGLHALRGPGLCGGLPDWRHEQTG